MKLARLAVPALAIALGAGEVAGRARPARPDWVRELHPLLGAAPEGSFARRAYGETFADYRGRVFARARPASGRLVLAGGLAAREALPALEAVLGPREVVLAAREGYGTAQEAVLLARFRPVLEPTAMVAIDGEELVAPSRPPGWTPEWDWQEASIRSPAGELLARWSGLARFLFVRPETALEPFERRLESYLRGVRQVATLAREAKVDLHRVFVAPAALEPARAEEVRAALARVEGERLHASVEALAASLR